MRGGRSICGHFDGTYLHLTGAFCNPKPAQRPRPPINIDGRSTATLRLVAEHADPWSFCAEIGRDPASTARSMVLPVSYEHPGNSRDSVAEAVDADFEHIVLISPAPYPENVARRVTDEIITTSV